MGTITRTEERSVRSAAKMHGAAGEVLGALCDIHTKLCGLLRLDVGFFYLPPIPRLGKTNLFRPRSLP